MKSKFLVVAAMATAILFTFATAAFAAHTDVKTYAAPAGGSANLGGFCLSGDLNSCVESDPFLGETTVSVTIDDAQGLPVFGTVGQDLNGDGFTDWSESFCGTTDVKFPAGLTIEDEILGQPVPVIVFPWLLPGVDETSLEPCPGVATSGTVTFTFN